VTANDRYTRPLASSAALVLIDVQRDFLDLPDDGAAMPVAGTCAAIPAMAKLATAFRERRLPIVHVIRLYQPGGSNVELVRRQSIEQGARIAVPGSAGSQIAAELLPNVVELDHELLLAGGFQRVGAAEHVVYKPRWGALFNTCLDRHLRESGSNTPVFAGCNFPNCPRTSIHEASERDFRIVLVSDAISGLYDRGVEECRAIGAKVLGLSETLDWLARWLRVSLSDIGARRPSPNMEECGCFSVSWSISSRSPRSATSPGRPRSATSPSPHFPPRSPSSKES
jgi:nicotinamidase-related amidase